MFKNLFFVSNPINYFSLEYQNQISLKDRYSLVFNIMKTLFWQVIKVKLVSLTIFKLSILDRKKHLSYKFTVPFLREIWKKRNEIAFGNLEFAIDNSMPPKAKSKFIKCKFQSKHNRLYFNTLSLLFTILYCNTVCVSHSTINCISD